MRKSQPLTKELAQKIFDILKEPDDNIAKHLKIALFVKYEIIKPRVEQLLKEIEKLPAKPSEADLLIKKKNYLQGYQDAIFNTKQLIKEVFKGAVEE